jgi:hypothetical protein
LPYQHCETTHANITTIGSLRDYSVNKMLIKHFKNKKDYFLNYIGSGPAEQKLIYLTKSIQANNVIFHGYYDKSNEIALLQNTSYFNILTDNSINSRTLMSNRFYLSVFLGKPMMVFADTYQGKVAQEFNLGFLLNRHDNLALQLDFYVRDFSPFAYNEGRIKFLETVKNDVADFSQKIANFLN